MDTILILRPGRDDGIDGPLCSLEDLLLSPTLTNSVSSPSSAPQPPNVVSQKITFLITKTLDFDLSHS